MVEQSRGKSLLAGDGDDAAAASRRTLFEANGGVTAQPKVIVVSDPTAKPSPEPEQAIDEAPQPEAETKRKVNPWLAALWVVGLVVTAIGVWGQVAYMQELYGPQPTTDRSIFNIISVIAAFSPTMILAGIVLVGIALAIHALGWAKKNGSL